MQQLVSIRKDQRNQIQKGAVGKSENIGALSNKEVSVVQLQRGEP
jgi:hypothetical protein